MAVLYPSIGGLGGRFTLHRPYLAGVVCSWVHGSVTTLVDTTWTIEGVYTGITTDQVMTFKPEFFNWNSNRYTIDWVLSDYYYVNHPGGPLATLPLNPQIHFRPGSRRLYLSLDSLGFPDLYYLDLPPAPDGWWSGRA